MNTLRRHLAPGEPSDYANEITVDEAVAELLVQIRNTSSALFAGNVTVAVDPAWGLSGDGGVPREYSPHLSHQVCGAGLLLSCLVELVAICTYHTIVLLQKNGSRIAGSDHTVCRS